MIPDYLVMLNHLKHTDSDLLVKGYSKKQDFIDLTNSFEQLDIYSDDLDLLQKVLAELEQLFQVKVGNRDTADEYIALSLMTICKNMQTGHFKKVDMYKKCLSFIVDNNYISKMKTKDLIQFLANIEPNYLLGRQEYGLEKAVQTFIERAPEMSMDQIISFQSAINKLQKSKFIPSFFNTQVMQFLINSKVEDKINSGFLSQAFYISQTMAINNYAYFPLAKALNKKYEGHIDKMNPRQLSFALQNMIIIDRLGKETYSSVKLYLQRKIFQNFKKLDPDYHGSMLNAIYDLYKMGDYELAVQFLKEFEGYYANCSSDQELSIVSCCIIQQVVGLLTYWKFIREDEFPILRRKSMVDKTILRAQGFPSEHFIDDVKKELLGFGIVHNELMQEQLIDNFYRADFRYKDFIFEFNGPCHYLYDPSILDDEAKLQSKWDFTVDLNKKIHDIKGQVYFNSLYQLMYENFKIPLDIRQAVCHNGLFYGCKDSQHQLDMRATKHFRKMFLNPEIKGTELSRRKFLKHRGFKQIDIPFHLYKEASMVGRKTDFIKFLLKFHKVI
ncbi:UNKNOWN [Stylonychia lemnae]|uniref:Uncharacterized protein n=1 Tax=Stylonychia lemnae TaxID=5949 RepID=A0A078A4V0_STYLE|nr:UNKNOWN [Stylonychia lemnae]|eukprot:CDW77219.1 UNKNOWN [Stylonychia lemnae]